MEILAYEPTMLPELTSAYNSLISGLPHCYPARMEDFASAVAAIEKEGGRSRLHSETAFVVKEKASILGFTHVAVERPEKRGKTEAGIIRFFWYERGRRIAGQSLLDAAERYFRQRKLSRIKAFHQDYRYPIYHVAHAYLSDRLGHIHGLLGFNGYRRIAGEVYLDWPDCKPAVPSPVDVSARISVQLPKGRGTRPGVIVLAHQGKKEIGICECVSCGEFSQHDEAQDWILTTWLGISQEMQGRGLGRYLLQRALQEANGIGYRHATISTNWQNFRALLLYSNYGYHIVDWTYALGRRLKTGSIMSGNVLK